ncbi:MAG: TetR/AcrR family transcriptional regulator [Nocardioides sp.]|uniref:TetR/AcrR family transcriptional regulator n=1 Tax=Nocardioides sp. TaxID=35761 RepID=UPI0039E6A45A
MAQSRRRDTSPERASARRRTVATYFDAALRLLDTEGYGGLKLAPLCKEIGLTTGAFYHNFASWSDFTTQLLRYWHEERTTRLIAIMNTEPDPIARLELLLATATALPHGAEAAIRVWSTIDPEVRAVQLAVDSERIAVVIETFSEMVGRAEAVHFARTALYLLIGHELAGPASDPASLSWALRNLISLARSRS